jgi:hypothetical protein
MKNNSRMFTYIISILGSFIMIFNLKKNYIDEVWNYFFVLLIFMLNGNEFIKFLKEKKTKNEKNR